MDRVVCSELQSQIDLSTEGEVVLRDRGYFGAKAKGIDFTMKRRTTDQPIGELDKEYNKLISKIGSPCERPHAVIKRISKRRKSSCHYSQKSSRKNDDYHVRL
ncbi:MAG: hypothetical protein A4E44_01332 [Methanosaeta sp. PtaB.Bin018]|jgi:IS5 family transposase|nr:hypothetical protein [Methanothrix sp.]OPX75500.1 MAG: hypothetical protein A4E44_01332 [Methanosaeta sp. PtaB.Bin018]